MIERYTGTNCTGIDGATSRTLTLDNLFLTNDNSFNIFVNGLFLHLTTDYTVDHNPTETVITFVNVLWNENIIAVEYYEGETAPSIPVGGTGVLPLDRQFLIDEITYFGNTITLRSIVRTYSEWGDSTDVNTDTTDIKAVSQYLTNEDEYVKQGTFLSNDIRVFFPITQTNVALRNQIYWDTKWFEIKSIIKRTIGDIAYSYEVIASNI